MTKLIKHIAILCHGLLPIALVIVLCSLVWEQAKGGGCTAPGNVTATSATDIACSSFQANWDLPTGTVNNYYIDVSTDNFASSVAGYPKFTSSTNLFYVVTGLDASTYPTYYYRIRAYNSSSGGCLSPAWSNIITVTMPAGCYCPSYATATTYSYISNVTFNTINNSSTGCANYTDFTSISTTVSPGSSYDLTITKINDCTGTTPFTGRFAAWIDWNNDRDFADAGEQVLTDGAASNGPVTASVTVPGGATIGTTRMRCIFREGATAPPFCGSYTTWGETEDYSVFICPAPPTAPITTGASRCGTGTVILTASGAGAGEDYKWYDALTGGTLLQTNGATYTTPSISVTTTYYVEKYNTTYPCSFSAPRTAVIATVNDLPTITVHPASTSACIGGVAAFSVTATGTGLTYQWQEFIVGWINVTNGGVYSGATTATLTLTGVTAPMNNYQYQCIVTGTCAPAVTSSAAILTVGAPTIQSSNLTFSGVTSSQMTVTWTNGNGSKRIVKINTVNSFTAPVDGTDPPANSVYSGGEQVVYNNTGNSVTVTGLAACVVYWFRVYDASCSGGSIVFSTATGANNPLNKGNGTTPTEQASTITFSGVTGTQMIVGWINGNGSKRIVKINTVNSFTAPVNGTDPAANSVYGGAGEQVVYNSTGNSVTVTGLSACITYWFRVYEANCSGAAIVFYTTTDFNNPLSQTTGTAPTIQASSIAASGIMATQMTVSWINGNGSKRIVKMNTVNSFTAPVDGTDPAANPVYGGGEQVVYSSTASSVTVTNLVACTAYWFRVYEANCSGTIIVFSTATGVNNPRDRSTIGCPGNCFDNIQNNGETGIDCGPPCPACSCP